MPSPTQPSRYFTPLLLAASLTACTPNPPASSDAAVTRAAVVLEAGSCVGRCGGHAGSCWCDALCADYDDCCADKHEVCPAPAGDQCDEPILVDTVPFVADGAGADTSTASDLMRYQQGACEGEPGGWGGGAPEQFYAFTAPLDGVFAATLTPEPGFDSNLYVTGMCEHGVTQTCIAADEQVGAGAEERVAFPLHAGETVYIVVDGWGVGARGRYTLAIDYDDAHCSLPFDHRLDAEHPAADTAPSRPADSYVFRIAAHHSCLNCPLTIDDGTIETVRANADAVWITADALGAMRAMADEGAENQALEALVAGGQWPVYTASNVSTLAWREMAVVGEDLGRVNSFDYQRAASTSAHPETWAMEVEPSDDLPGNLVIDDALLGYDPVNNPFSKANREALYQYPVEFQRAEEVFDADEIDFPGYQTSATCKARAPLSTYRPPLPAQNVVLGEVENAPGLRTHALARIWDLHGSDACTLPMVQCDESETLAGAVVDEDAWTVDLVPSHIGFGRAGYFRHCLRPEDATSEFIGAACHPAGPCPDSERGWDLYGGEFGLGGYWTGDGVLDVATHACHAPGTAPYIRRLRHEFPAWDRPGDGFGHLLVQDMACLVPDPSKPATAEVVSDALAEHAVASGAQGIASDNMGHVAFGAAGTTHAANPWLHPDGDRNVFVVSQGYSKRTQMHRPAYPERELGQTQAQQNFTDDWATLWLRTRSEIHCNPALSDFTWMPNANGLLPVVQAASQNLSYADEQKMTLDLLGGGMWDEKWGNLDFHSDLLRRRALHRLLAAQRISSLGRPTLLSLQFQGFSDFDPDPAVNYDGVVQPFNSLGEPFTPEPAGIDNSYAFARGLAAYLIVLDRPSLLLDPYRWYGDPQRALDGVGTFEKFARNLAGTTWMRHFLDRDAGAPLMTIAGATEPDSHHNSERDATVIYRRYERALAVMHTRGEAIGGTPVAVQAPAGQDWFLDVVLPWGGWAKVRDKYTPSPLACDVTQEFSVAKLIECRKRHPRSVEDHGTWTGCQIDFCHGQGDSCLQENRADIATCHANSRRACDEVCATPSEATQTIVRRVHIPGGTWLRLHPNRSLLIWAQGAERDLGNEALRHVDIETCATPEAPAYPGVDVCGQLHWPQPEMAVRVALPAQEPGPCTASVRDFRCAPGDVD